ncbi:uncharacterized protein At3g28850-like [Gastrolobium bilobum]|uniref:uncharacterized protein At3g28850-like n=1 Tax=Gastrolobium bilobum TaxID=150636 RepID=UPI002AB23EAC|nr:uncharacterized protein At3g28850-like [Gastrolobium bilobum]
MGCVNSKQNKCSHCNTPYSPVPRSYSMHVHHPPQSKGDSYHVVALTSTTLGSLDLQVSHNHANGFGFSKGKVSDSDSDSFKQQEKNEAMTWSNMIEQKLPKAIPKTPITTPPPCEPETINTWELMEGLEDTSPFRSPKHFKSFSFDPPKSSFVENDSDSNKPIWLQMMTEEASNLNAGVSDSDELQVDSSFQKSSLEKQESMASKVFSFEEKKISDDVVMDFNPAPFGKDKVVLYFTSLRGVRKTYEDCCNVRHILKGLGVRVDERDLSMHLGFKEELKELLGHEFGKGGLPRVFIGRSYIGGVEDIQKLHEDGKLEKLLDCCEKIDDSNGGDAGGVCDACGAIRFVPCETCYGSCKIYYEDDDDEEEDGEVGDYGFQRCPDCNENGLIRCPMCCY